MKRWIAVMAVVLAVAPMARADEASKEAKAKELFATMHMDKMMRQMTDAMVQQVKQMSQLLPGADEMTATQKKLVNDYQDRMMTLVYGSVGWSALEPEYVKLYAATYSEEELEGILTFYKSSAGQAMLAKTPELTTGAMKIVQSKMVDLQPQIKALMDQMVQEISASATKSPAKN